MITRAIERLALAGGLDSARRRRARPRRLTAGRSSGASAVASASARARSSASASSAGALLGAQRALGLERDRLELGARGQVLASAGSSASASPRRAPRRRRCSAPRPRAAPRLVGFGAAAPRRRLLGAVGPRRLLRGGRPAPRAGSPLRRFGCSSGRSPPRRLSPRERLALRLLVLLLGLFGHHARSPMFVAAGPGAGCSAPA